MSQHNHPSQAVTMPLQPTPAMRDLFMQIFNTSGDFDAAYSAMCAVATTQQEQNKDAVPTAEPGAWMPFFAFDENVGFERFATANEAMSAAKASLDEYRNEAMGDGWADAVEGICWGIVLGATRETDLGPCEDGSEFDRHADFSLALTGSQLAGEPVMKSALQQLINSLTALSSGDHVIARDSLSLANAKEALSNAVPCPQSDLEHHLNTHGNVCPLCNTTGLDPRQNTVGVDPENLKDCPICGGCGVLSTAIAAYIERFARSSIPTNHFLTKAVGQQMLKSAQRMKAQCAVKYVKVDA